MHSLRLPISRRAWMAGTSATCVAAWCRGAMRAESALGFVVGEPAVEGVGAKILADGGNAFDALIATALAGAVTELHQTGLGGYGTHGVFAAEGGRRIVALDANTAAPAAMRADLFQPGADGRVPGAIHEHGWLASGVPGVIAGLKLALDEFGTMPFRDVLAPAIRLTREGFRVSTGLAAAFAGSTAGLKKDAASARLYLSNERAPVAGSVWKNPALAEVIETLARANSAEPFYRGDLALRIAEAFAKNGGLVTAQDLAAYRARLVEPVSLAWGAHTVHTAPLTAGGFSVLQMLALLSALDWAQMPAGLPRTHARLEAMRLAWRDRLTLLGDPDFVDVPQAKLLSADYAREGAEQIMAAVKAGRILDHALAANPQDGTLNFSACDRHGNFGALTLTHGSSFGAQVTVDGLGLTLGHGMSRFDPRPGHPNAPAPGKRPLHNMAPTLITRQGRAIVAVGGRGGRKIPNALFEFLTQYLVEQRTFEAAMEAPRVHTEGDAALDFEKAWPAAETAALPKLGYRVKTGGSATLSAVADEGGALRAAMR